MKASKIYSILMMTMMMNACGQENAAQTTGIVDTSLTTKSDEPTETKASVTEKQNDADDLGSAMLVASINAMPRCTRDTDGQLIYVKDISQFYFCSDLVWQGIDLKGKNGKDGEDGQDGINGQNGVNGINGLSGRDGRDGKSIQAADEFTWYHPVNDTKWFIGRSILSVYYSGTTPNLLSDNFICPEGSRLPTEDEYTDALAAGIWAKFGAKQPLLIGLGYINNSINYTYGNNQQGIQSFYSFRVGKNASGAITDLFNSGYGSATALCIVE